MKKDNWRFEALARAKIIRQEEEAKAMKHIEDFKPAEEIERLQNINADLLEACKMIVELLDYMTTTQYSAGYDKPARIILNQAITKAEGRK